MPGSIHHSGDALTGAAKELKKTQRPQMMVLANLQFINSNNIKVEIASQPEAAHGRGSGEIRFRLPLPPSVRGHGKMCSPSNQEPLTCASGSWMEPLSGFLIPTVGCMHA